MTDEERVVGAIFCFVMALVVTGLVAVGIGMAYAAAWHFFGIVGTLVVTAWWATCFWFTLGRKIRAAVHEREAEAIFWRGPG